MENNPVETTNVPVEAKKKSSNILIWIILIVLVVIFYFTVGFIAIQPIGAIPDGVTLVVLRLGTQIKFFDSPDAICERTMAGVSLLCRAMAMGALAKNSTILFKLPYIPTFYLFSTGGAAYDK